MTEIVARIDGITRRPLFLTLNDMTDQQRGRRAIEVGPTGRIVAENIARLRDRRGFTTRQLAGALERAGRPIPASGITRMEKAERVVTVDDLIALAVVLKVSPSALLLQLKDGPSETIEITGFGEAAADQAWRWLDGEGPLDMAAGNDSTELLEYDLYARPPRRRRTWSNIRDLVTITDPDAHGARLARRLTQEEPEEEDNNG